MYTTVPVPGYSTVTCSKLKNYKKMNFIYSPVCTKEKIATATGVLMAKWDFGTKWIVKPLLVL